MPRPHAQLATVQDFGDEPTLPYDLADLLAKQRRQDEFAERFASRAASHLPPVSAPQAPAEGGR